MKNDDVSKSHEDYRRVLATANKLETIQSNLESVIDLFLTPIVKLYTKLCNDCMKLLFECEFKLDHFRKAEELVWRRIYHDIYRFQKTKRQHMKRHEECLIESHFISGIGFYSSFIVKLRTHYKISDVPALIAPLNLSLGPLDSFVDNQRWNGRQNDDRYDEDYSNSTSDGDPNDKLAEEWARHAIYRSLVYMGDLARYLLEISQFDYRKLAFQFYLSASKNQPDQGLPFNQLATLAGGLNHNLDAVCNYMRCCLRLKPFEGADGNMRKIFDLNKKFYEDVKISKEHCKISHVLASKEPTIAAESMLQTVLVIFIKLTSDLWSAITSDSGNLLKEDIVEETQLFFEVLREALELEPIVPLAPAANDYELEFCPISGGSSFSDKPRFISPTIMYEFCCISIMLIAKCQKRYAANATAPISDYIIDLVNTLALNLLHYSTSKCQKQILSKVQELRVSRQDFLSSDRKAIARPEPNLKNSAINLSDNQKSSDTINSLSEATSRRALSRLRQRKAATNYSDTKLLKPATGYTEDSEMSELEETALSTIDALEISSDMSEEAEHQINDLIDFGSSSDESFKEVNRRLPYNPGSYNSLSKPVLRPTRSQNYEFERSLNATTASNSLPVPDLLTGDIIEQVNFKTAAETSQSPLESPSGSDVKCERTFSKTSTDKISHAIHANELDASMAFLYTQTYLASIKIFCDWLLSDGDIIGSNLQSFRAFRTELDDLVTLLKELRKIAETNDATITTTIKSSQNGRISDLNYGMIYKHTYDGPTWLQRYPLSCDYPLLNLEPLKNVHDLNIDFKCQKKLNEPEAGFVTFQCIEAFFCALTAALEKM